MLDLTSNLGSDATGLIVLESRFGGAKPRFDGAGTRLDAVELENVQPSIQVAEEAIL